MKVDVSEHLQAVEQNGRRLDTNFECADTHGKVKVIQGGANTLKWWSWYVPASQEACGSCFPDDPSKESLPFALRDKLDKIIKIQTARKGEEMRWIPSGQTRHEWWRGSRVRRPLEELVSLLFDTLLHFPVEPVSLTLPESFRNAQAQGSHVLSDGSQEWLLHSSGLVTRQRQAGACLPLKCLYTELLSPQSQHNQC